MNWLDIIILVFMLLNLWTGFNRGFLNEILSSFAWICAIVVAYLFTGEAYQLAAEYLPLLNEQAIGQKNIYMLFSIVFFGVALFVCQFLLRFITIPLKSLITGRVNSFLGLCLGGFKAFVFMSIIWYGLKELNAFENIELLVQARRNSLPQTMLNEAATMLKNLIPTMLTSIIK